MAQAPRPTPERENPLIALLGIKTEEEKIAQEQTDQLVDSVDGMLMKMAKSVVSHLQDVGNTISTQSNDIIRELQNLQKITQAMLTVTEQQKTSDLLKTKEEQQELAREQRGIWNRVFDFFGNAFEDLKDFFKVKKEWSWWDLIKEAAFWITAVGIAYFWRFYKVIETAIRGIKNLYNWLREGKLLSVLKDWSGKAIQLMKGWIDDIFRWMKEGVIARVGRLFQNIWNTIRESKLFKFFGGIWSKIVLLSESLFLKISSITTVIVRELGLLLREIKFLGGVIRASKFGVTVSAWFTQISNLFRTILMDIKNSEIGLFVQRLIPKITSIFTRIVEFITPAINYIRGLFTGASGLFPKIVSLFSRVMEVVGVLGNYFMKAFNVVRGVFTTLLTAGKYVFDIVRNIGQWIVRFVPFVGRLIKVVPVLGWIITAIDGIIGAVKGFFASEGKSMLERIGMVFQGIIAGIVSGLTLGFLEFDQIMGWFDKVTDWLGEFFYQVYAFFTDTLPSFFTESIPNFFTKTIPEFFSWLGNMIWDGLKFAADMVWDAITYPFVMVSDFFSNLVTDLKVMFAKIDLWIAEALNVFGEDEDDPDVIAARRKLQRLESQRSTGQLSRLDQQVRQEERRLTMEAAQGSGGNATVNYVNTNNNATSTFATSPQPATESDPSLRRAAANIPNYAAGF